MADVHASDHQRGHALLEKAVRHVLQGGGGGYTMAGIVVDDESGDRLIYMTVVLRVIHVTVIVDGCDSRWQ